MSQAVGKITLCLEGKTIINIDRSKGLEDVIVEVRDYDCDGPGESLRFDEDGDLYEEIKGG